MSSLEVPSQRPVSDESVDRSQHAMLDALVRAGVEIEEVNRSEFPESVSNGGFEGLSKRGQDYFEGLVVASRRFWNGLIIKDHFDLDEEARTEFEKRMLQRFPDFKEFERRSKLRTNVQSELFGLFRGLVRELDKNEMHTPQSERVREINAFLFPIDDAGRNTLKAQEAAAQVTERFPSLPPLYEPEQSSISYRTYYLQLTEQQRYEIIKSFDSAAHDFLELVTVAPDDVLAEKTNT